MTFEIDCETCRILADLLATRVEPLYRGMTVSQTLYNITLVVAGIGIVVVIGTHLYGVFTGKKE